MRAGAAPASSKRVGGLELKRRRGEALGDGVVDLAGEAVALLDRAGLRASRIEPGTVDGDAEHVADGVEEAQIVGRELPPLGARDVHHAELAAVGVERDAGMEAEAGRALAGKPFEPAAGDDVDVGGAVEIALAEGVEAIAGAGHPGGMADQARRQVLGGGEIRLAGRLVEEEDPAGVEAEERGDLRKCGAERGVADRPKR